MVRNRTGHIRKVLLTGGALKSKGGYAPQLYADILGAPVVARHGDEEGTAKGAAVLAAYMAACITGPAPASLAAFARTQVSGEEQIWEPSAAAAVYTERFNAFAEKIAERQQHETG